MSYDDFLGLFSQQATQENFKGSFSPKIRPSNVSSTTANQKLYCQARIAERDIEQSSNECANFAFAQKPFYSKENIMMNRLHS